MNEPIISIIVPAYNEQNCIERCIKSIQDQTIEDVEIIIVDDGSEDDTVHICRSLADCDRRVRIIREVHRGVDNARNIGINACRGKYLGFVDADDWIESEMCATLLGAMEEDKVDLVSSGLIREWSETRKNECLDRFMPGIYKETDYKDLLKRAIYDFENDDLQPLTPWLVNKLFVTRIMRDITANLGCNPSFAEDSMLLYRYMLRSCSISILDKSLYIYSYRESSASHKKNDHYLVDIGNVYETLKEEFEESPDRDILVPQLQKWIEIMMCVGLGRNMRFDERSQPIQFILDQRLICTTDVILYGAGKCGKDYYKQLRECDCNIIAWCDKDYRHYNEFGLPIKSIDEYVFEGNEGSGDTILLAVSNKAVAKEIENELISKGVNPRRIMWKEPIRAY